MLSLIEMNAFFAFCQWTVVESGEVDGSMHHGSWIFDEGFIDDNN